jgi:hypothetical protein
MRSKQKTLRTLRAVADIFTKRKRSAVMSAIR